MVLIIKKCTKYSVFFLTKLYILYKLSPVLSVQYIANNLNVIGMEVIDKSLDFKWRICYVWFKWGLKNFMILLMKGDKEK